MFRNPAEYQAAAQQIPCNEAQINQPNSCSAKGHTEMLSTVLHKASKAPTDRISSNGVKVFSKQQSDPSPVKAHQLTSSKSKLDTIRHYHDTPPSLTTPAIPPPGQSSHVHAPETWSIRPPIHSTSRKTPGPNFHTTLKSMNAISSDCLQVSLTQHGGSAHAIRHKDLSQQMNTKFVFAQWQTCMWLLHFQSHASKVGRKLKIPWLHERSYWTS